MEGGGEREGGRGSDGGREGRREGGREREGGRGRERAGGRGRVREEADLLLSSAEHLLEILHPQRLQRLLARSVRDSHVWSLDSRVWSRDSHVWVVSRACLRVGVADAGPYTINPKPSTLHLNKSHVDNVNNPQVDNA